MYVWLVPLRFSTYIFSIIKQLSLIVLTETGKYPFAHKSRRDSSLKISFAEIRNHWVENKFPLETFWALGSIQYVVCSSFLVVSMKEKRISKNDFFRCKKTSFSRRHMLVSTTWYQSNHSVRIRAVNSKKKSSNF